MEESDWNLLTNSKFWKPENDVHYRVTFTNWRLEFRTFRSETKQKPKLVMDVIEVFGKKYASALEFSTGNVKLISKLRPLMERAQAAGRNTVCVFVEKNAQQDWNVIDASIVDQAVNS